MSCAGLVEQDRAAGALSHDAGASLLVHELRDIHRARPQRLVRRQSGRHERAELAVR